jgi:predicted DNA-binding protein YlxM (UPF0122 family)
MLEYIDFKKQPYSGIFSIVARKHGVSRGAIYQSIKRGSTRYLDDINIELKKRKELVDRFNTFAENK